MTNAILGIRSDNTVFITRKAPNSKKTLEEIAAQTTPSDCEFRLIEESVIPLNDKYMGAWRADIQEYATYITIDLETAKEIHKDILRGLRAPLLAQLDIDINAALLSGDPEEVDEVRSRRQALLDVTDDPGIDAAETFEELEAYIPAILQP